MILVEADTSEEWDSRVDWGALAQAGVHAAVAQSRHAMLGQSAMRLEISVRFASDEEVRALNAAWRGKDKATNVLSFPMVAAEHLGALGSAVDGEALLGDIVLAHGVCAAEAADKAVPVQSHAAHLIVHGALHLLDYDHEHGAEEAEAMESIERDALLTLGIADPYMSETSS